MVRRAGRLTSLLLILVFVPPVVNAQSARSEFERSSALVEDGIALLDDSIVSSSLGGFYRALEINPQFADAAIGLARAYSWLGEYDEALEWAKHAISVRPGDTRADLIYAQTKALSGDVDGATELYAKVLAREPYNERAQVGQTLLNLASGRVGFVLNSLESLYARYPENRQILLSLALLFGDRGDYDRSIEFQEIALRQYPQMPAVHLLAAEIALDNGDLERADRYARNAVSLQPRLNRAWTVLVATSVANENLAMALAQTNELINIDPQNGVAWYDRGVLLGKLGRTDDAISALERSLTIRPDYSVARIALERVVLDETPMDDPRRGALAQPYEEWAQQLSSRYLDRQAEQLLRHALRIDPFNTLLRTQLAELLFRQGYPARSLKELQISVDLGLDDRSVTGRIEGLNATLADTPSQTWAIDQFVQERPRLRIGTFLDNRAANQTAPFAGEVVVSHLRSVLGYYEHVVAGVDGSFLTESDAVQQARDGANEYALLISVIQVDPVAQIGYKLVLTRNSRTVIEGVVRRSGNGNLVAAVAKLVQETVATVPQAANVLVRRFDDFVVSMGRTAGLASEMVLPVVQAGSFRVDASGRKWEFDSQKQVGTAVVADIDDLLAVCAYKTLDGIDRLSTGSVVLLDRPDSETGANPQGSMEPEQTASRDVSIPPDLFRRVLSLLD